MVEIYKDTAFETSCRGMEAECCQNLDCFVGCLMMSFQLHRLYIIE